MNANQDWMKKLESEQALSMAESHQLDEQLKSQSQIAQAIRALKDEEPSLAWRSQLNERLIGLQAPVAKSRWNRRWGFAGLGTAVAATASLMIIMNAKQPVGAPVAMDQPNATSAEQILLDAHQGAVFALSTGAGDGSQPIRSESESSVHHWTEAELEAF